MGIHQQNNLSYGVSQHLISWKWSTLNTDLTKTIRVPISFLRANGNKQPALNMLLIFLQLKMSIVLFESVKGKLINQPEQK